MNNSIWHTRNGKYKGYVEDTHAVTTCEVVFNAEYDLALEVAECSACGGLFGVDASYLDQVDTFVHCPMCCTEIELLEKLDG